MKIILLTLLFLSSFCYGGDFSTHEIINKKSELGKVYYTPFEVDLYASIPESKFEIYSDCISYIKFEKLHQILTPTNFLYEMGNPRAKIIYKNNVYFISQEGIVTNFKETFKLKSIKEFEREIRKDSQPNSNGSNKNFDSCSK